MVGALAVAGTFLLAAAFYAATAHVAASYVLGDPPVRGALAVGPVPAAVVVAGLAAGVPAAAVVLAAVAVDAFAVAAAYDLDARGTALVTGAHVVVAVALGFALRNIALLVA